MPSILSSPVRVAPQQERSTRRLAGFLDAAAELFAEVGYEAATMTAVAERSGSSMGRMTRWRKSKIRNANRERFLGLRISECSCGEPLYPRYGSRGPHLDAVYCKTRFKGGPGCGAQSIKRVDLAAAIDSVVVMLDNVDFLMDALNTALALRKAAPDPACKQREQPWRSSKLDARRCSKP
jgi:hypothetical protein